MGTAFIIDVVLMLSMAGLFSLILLLHFKLKEFGRDAMRVPALADDLTKAITTSRTVMQELAQTARTDGTKLEQLVSTASRSTQELTYLIDRAEKVLERFDGHINNGSMRLNTPEPAPQRAATPAPTPTATPATAPRPMAASNQAAVMPGRYKKEMAAVPTPEKPFKPASFGATAAAYSTATKFRDEPTEDATPPVASEAERELRRALGATV